MKSASVLDHQLLSCSRAPSGRFSILWAPPKTSGQPREDTLPPRKKFSEEEQKDLVARLEVPFAPNEIKWRVVKTGQRGRRGAILPFADPRAYTDRLNQLFTPGGWSRVCVVSHVPSLCRQKEDKVIVTAKVLSAVAVTIHRLGSHTGAGEEWADEQNAATTADAQAFKRACSYFGLGRYLYRFQETWVNLDGARRPMNVPILPAWALPPGWFPMPPPDSGKKDIKGPIDHRLTSTIEDLRLTLGEAIYMEILERAGHSRTAKNIPNADRQKSVLQWLQAAGRGLERAHQLAGTVDESQFVAIMDSLKVSSLESVPSLDTLKCLVDTLEGASEQQVA